MSSSVKDEQTGSRGGVLQFVRRNLYVQVLIAVAIGITLGHFAPQLAVAMKPFGDAFIKLIKMTIGLVIFFTVVAGISGIQSVGKVGRIGGFAVIYFEVFSTIALLIGLVVGNLLRPGEGFNVAAAHFDPASIKQYVSTAQSHGLIDFFLSIIPSTFMGAFTDDSVLPIVFVSLLTGIVLRRLGEKGKVVRDMVDGCSRVVFGCIGIIMKFAPVGAFGAMAFTIGKFGIGSLQSLLYLILTFYVTSALFVVIVLGAVGHFCGFNILSVIRYFKDELLLVLATSSSDAALPSLMEKLEKLGCEKGIVGLVMPAGYVFNSDGTNIYITLALLFLAQAMHVDLTIGHQLLILAVASLTTKGSAGVPGAGFVSLVATLALVPQIPMASVAMLLGIDRMISECRAIVNVIGNVVATLVVAKREGDLDTDNMRKIFKANRTFG
ncbi:C4-dicarboxylate transporter DctA [Burkholderia multivorans]|nr:C4-dicarboxylate transporter DctA [Burkholderia multivorans]